MRKKTSSPLLKRQIPLFVMMALPAALVLVYSYGPMFGLVMAFQDFEPALGFFGSEWVGLYNFERVFQIPDIWSVVWNTFFIATMKIFLGMIASILVAILLNELQSRIFKRTVQTIIYAPYFLSWVILGGIFRELLSSDGLAEPVFGDLWGIGGQFLGRCGNFPLGCYRDRPLADDRI